MVVFSLQADRRALATNEWLQVKGCQNVYALGDCATIDQRKIMVSLCLLYMRSFFFIKKKKEERNSKVKFREHHSWLYNIVDTRIIYIFLNLLHMQFFFTILSFNSTALCFRKIYIPFSRLPIRTSPVPYLLMNSKKL